MRATHSTGTAGVYGYVIRVSPEPDREWAVCVYCASGPTHPELLSLAVRVGEAIAKRGWTLVYTDAAGSAAKQVWTSTR